MALVMKSEEYRRHAAQCMRAAELARTADAKQMLMAMAERWNDLAQRAQRAPLESREAGASGAGGGGAR